MSIVVENLSKYYDEQKAVDSLSFEAVPGEILGFLGPNGAGKSTTMRIATGYIPPSAGTVYVNGLNILEHSLQVRRNIGYLAENNPLYTEMYIREFLKFCGSVYGISGKKLNNRVEEMIQVCGLQAERGKRIRQLSKGYKQRVGLAQSLIHDPSVLILDEPTSGFDPNQIQDIRKLIVELSHNKTVILSTHIMQEVEAICDKVVIINKGKRVAYGTLPEIRKQRLGVEVLQAEFLEPVDLQELRTLPFVVEIEEVGSKKLRIFCSGKEDPRTLLFHYARDKNLTLLGLIKEENSLEKIFHDLTINQKEEV
jgi:ABC-2 type transport system ATP-binding protein